MSFKARILGCISLVIGSLAVVSCNDEDNNFAIDTGSLSPHISVDAKIVSPVASSIQELGFEVPSPDDFIISISDKSGFYKGEWSSVKDFPANEPFKVGEYVISAFSTGDDEGFSSPRFGCSTVCNIYPDKETRVDLNCPLSNSIITVNYDEILQDAVADIDITLHSMNGNEYFTYSRDEKRPLFLAPGDVSIFARVSMTSGETVRLNVGKTIHALSAHHYIVSLSADVAGPYPVLKISTSDSEEAVNIELSDKLLKASAPELVPSGFSNGVPMSLTEGDTPSPSVAVDIKSGNLKSLVLTTKSAGLKQIGLPVNIDLLNNKSDLNILLAAGLQFEGNQVDFTHLLSNIDYVTGDNRSTFILVATDELGLVNEPVELIVETVDPDITLISISDAVVGSDRMKISLKADTENLKDALSISVGNNESFKNTEITNITPAGNGTYDVTFKIPDGTSDFTTIIYFNGREKERFTVKRVPPVFTLSVDPFARFAKIKINADDASTVAAVTRYLRVYDSSTSYNIFSRDEKNGIIEIVDLTPDTQYKVKATVMDRPDENEITKFSFETEKILDVPNGDFEDTVTDIEYSNLPSGGAYSQNMVEIFNCQNTVSFNVDLPKGWATTNKKTFCMSASNKNTWYMQPSVMIVNDGANSLHGVELRSVAWDVAGAAIPPYVQQEKPYLHYNPYVPEIYYNCAGRMWLGSYSFNPATLEEKIVEGVKFTSRPSTLTGFYKCTPGSPTSTVPAIAIVKLWGNENGNEIIIGQGEKILSFTSDYESFSVPITYHAFGVKATKMTVIFASSTSIGDIQYETTHVATYPDCVTASSIGTRLSIDKIKFAY